MKTIPLILALIFGASLVCGCNDDVELPLLDGGGDLKHGDAGLGKDLHAQDSAIDQQAGEDSSPDVIEDADLNGSMDIEADLNNLQTCDAVCREVDRECEIVPIFLGMGGCIAEYGPETFFTLGCDVIPEASHQGVAITRQECKCGPVN